ncbi:MAG: glycosyltransferase [Halothece sp. Uz-M2-17]|nr:glycosyltransferase [Halothece sp. Uz-M2-17]
MWIAQIAPLWERVPPPTYGGIELVVGLLTEELVRRGHEVTLFATGESQTSARLGSVYPQAMRLDSKVNAYDIYNAIQLERVYSKADQFDIIHSHVDYSAFPYVQFTSPQFAQTLQRRAIKRVQNYFSWSGVAGQLSGIYRSLLATSLMTETVFPQAGSEQANQFAFAF